MKWPIGLIAGAMLTTTAQATFCLQPTQPTVWLSKPTLPLCVRLKNCQQYDFEGYNHELDEYYGKLKQYADDVDQYYADAMAYVKCMAKIDN